MKRKEFFASMLAVMLVIFLGAFFRGHIPSVAAYYPSQPFMADQYTLALWHFDEGQGNTIHDSSGHGNDGTIYGASWTTGMFDGGLDFVNRGDYVTVPDNPDDSLDILCGDEFTVELWIYARQISRNGYNWNGWMTKGSNIGGTWTGWIFYACEYYPMFQPTFFGIGANVPVPPPTLQWVHVAVAYDGQSLKTYYNGILQDSNDVGHHYLIGNDVPVTFGCTGPYPWNDAVNAIIDEVRISSIDRTKISATIDVDPDTLNLKSNGEFVTVYIELIEGYNPAEINTATVELEGISALTDPTPSLMDHDGDGIMELMLKFDRATVRDTLTGMVDYEQGTKFYDMTVKVTGEINGTPFEGSDTIVVIKN